MNRIKGFLSYSQKQISLRGNPLNFRKGKFGVGRELNSEHPIHPTNPIHPSKD